MKEPHKHPSYRLFEIPEPPANMSEGARQEWVSLAKTVFELRTARAADLRLLELLCEVLADISELQKTIRKDGYTVEAANFIMLQEVPPPTDEEQYNHRDLNRIAAVVLRHATARASGHSCGF